MLHLIFLSLIFFFSRSPAPRNLHSFPTRRSSGLEREHVRRGDALVEPNTVRPSYRLDVELVEEARIPDRKSTRLNSSHLGISYAVFCLKKKKKQKITHRLITTCRITHSRTLACMM